MTETTIHIPAAERGRNAVPGLGTPDPRSPIRSRWTSLPPDVLRSVCHRTATLALAIAGVWAILLVLSNVIAPLVGHKHGGPSMAWPYPGNFIASAGIAASLATWWLAGRLGNRPALLINLGFAFQLVCAALTAYLTNWNPVFTAPRISWLCLIILIQPAVVPAPPLKTLAASLVIATLEPIAVWLAALRGVPIESDTLLMIWYFLPAYISAGLAMIPATIISGLGRRVNEARELGSYQLGERIGRGGMGEVYSARHRMLARPAAIKLIRPESLGNGHGRDPHVVTQRFHREAQAVALLQSPHTISLYDFGATDDGTFYYVMEMLDGFDLETLIRRHGPIPAERAIAFLRHACRSLGEAHARGLIHRDVKPSNLFTCRLGLNVDIVKVLDFGLVKLAGDQHPAESLLTQTDATTGTPAYMAPEMALGESVDRRADIYALGCVAYWLLTGKLVFEAETPVKTMLLHVQAEPVPPSRVSELPVPEELDRVVLRCLAKNPDDRFQDAMELVCALESVPLAQRWTRQRAEQWWQTHHPAPTPFTELHPPRPCAELHAAK